MKVVRVEEKEASVVAAFLNRCCVEESASRRTTAANGTPGGHSNDDCGAWAAKSVRQARPKLCKPATNPSCVGGTF